MQPNLGQGGCMAIEDGYQLSTDLAEAVQKAGGYPDIEAVLKVNRVCLLMTPTSGPSWQISRFYSSHLAHSSLLQPEKPSCSLQKRHAVLMPIIKMIE